MNEIKQFLNSFFDAEVEAWHASTKRDTDDTRQKIDKMHSFCIEKLHNKFGLVRTLVYESDDFYERNKDAPKSNPRHLFKLSYYSHEKYGDLYLAYVSINSPRMSSIKYFNCFFIANINNKLQIVKSYFKSQNEYDYTYDWVEGEGLQNITFETAGKFISCERYLEPSSCEFSMKDYLTEK
ncbi:hypothetical protein [Aureivirga sp. CE67]|uniref:hypothetical protein n=1 Tax=Aureivirga sp. CE67 TaxID=1788983 RepID=UPI0018CBCBB6|nr:hypothetical protein [Aureivirga sp. CE67]